MTSRSFTLDENRKLTVASAPVFEVVPQAPYVVLLPAYSAEEREHAAGMAATLLDHGCVEFCCVGPQAALLDDALDAIIEDRGQLDVVTTSFASPSEASEYFLHAAGGRKADLLALLPAHPELEKALLEELRGE